METFVSTEVPLTFPDGRCVFLPIGRDSHTEHSEASKLVHPSYDAGKATGIDISKLIRDIEEHKLSRSTLLDRTVCKDQGTEATQVVLDEKQRMHSELHETIVDVGTSCESVNQLWSEKYRATKFHELVSSSKANKSVVQWMVTWQRYVFKEVNYDEKEQAKSLFKGIEIDASGRPLFKIILLDGPPGCGKTTLAHVAAAHAGFSAIEVNASDEKQSESLLGKLENVFHNRNICVVSAGSSSKQGTGGEPMETEQTSSSTSASSSHRKAMGSRSLELDQRPKCLILDEADGLDRFFVAKLIKLLKQEKTGLGRNKPTQFRITRPIIMICNDFYATSALKRLREHVFFVKFSRPSLLDQRLGLSQGGGLDTERFIKRLKHIADEEEVFFEEAVCLARGGLANTVDSACLTYLAVFFEFDIRLCINALQTIKQETRVFCLSSQEQHEGEQSIGVAVTSRSSRAVNDSLTSSLSLRKITLSSVKDICRMFYKDKRSSIFDVLETLFRPTPRSMTAKNESHHRFNRFDVIKTNLPEAELILAGVQENLFNCSYIDSLLGATARTLDELSCFENLVSSRALLSYVPSMAFLFDNCVTIERVNSTLRFPKQTFALSASIREGSCVLTSLRRHLAAEKASFNLSSSDVLCDVRFYSELLLNVNTTSGKLISFSDLQTRLSELTLVEEPGFSQTQRKAGRRPNLPVSRGTTGKKCVKRGFFGTANNKVLPKRPRLKSDLIEGTENCLNSSNICKETTLRGGEERLVRGSQKTVVFAYRTGFSNHVKQDITIGEFLA